MTTVLLGLGSNIDPQRHIPLGISALQNLLGDFRASHVYEGDARGFVGTPFWNLVIEAQTPGSVGELQTALRDIEYAYGRPKNAQRFSSRALDIDILTFGDTVGSVEGVVLPRAEILDAAFVLRPLAELVPQTLHPALGLSFEQLWSAFDQASQPLKRVA
ncbi:MAG: 2-amino-4-hydroxy-6-hydroxymethyldihydropteridine diphosphokinase [Congregibacter sp.]